MARKTISDAHQFTYSVNYGVVYISIGCHRLKHCRTSGQCFNLPHVDLAYQRFRSQIVLCFDVPSTNGASLNFGVRRYNTPPAPLFR